MVSFDLPQLLEVWGAIIGAVESASDGLLGEGIFLNTFKDALIAKANDYPFLDPFAAKFSYKDGKVEFSGEVQKNFSQGIGDGLNETVGTLAELTALEGKDLFEPLRGTIDEMKINFQDQIDKFNLSAILPDLFD